VTFARGRWSVQCWTLTSWHCTVLRRDTVAYHATTSRSVHLYLGRLALVITRHTRQG
jgi:hypothetical protein